MALTLNVPIRFVYVFYFKWFCLIFYGFVLFYFILFLFGFFVILNGVSLRERLWICLCLIVCFLLFFFCYWNIWFFK